ncbi:MAG: hypothetical protein IT285_00950 [Bdellovibrionales bacterium]|nr:hypothetical protein [Bdellovibrionales bacterium]
MAMPFEPRPSAGLRWRKLSALPLAILAACSPIAPSLEKSLFPGPGAGVPGSGTLGTSYQTLMAADPASIPSDGILSLTFSEVQLFKDTRAVSLTLGTLPPGSVRGIFVLSLDEEDVATLSGFRTEFYRVSPSSNSWMLRVHAGTDSNLAQLVINNLEEIHLQFAVSASSSDLISGQGNSGEPTDVPPPPNPPTPPPSGTEPVQP